MQAPRAPPTKLDSIMKRALLILLAAVLLLPMLGIMLFYGYENWSGNVAWREAQAAMMAAGEPLSIDALRPAPIPDDENMAAAPIFRDLFTFYSPQRAEVYALRLPPPAPASKKGGDSALVALARRFNPDFTGSSAAAARVILKGLAPLEPMLEAVRGAAERPETVWPLKYERGFAIPVPFLSPFKRTAEVLAARAAVTISENQPDKALADFELITRLAREADQPPILVSCATAQVMLGHAINIVRDGLAQDVWSDQDLERIEKELSNFRLLASFAEGVRGERALFLASPAMVTARAESLFTLVDFRSSTSEWITSTLCRVVWKMRPSGWMARDQASYCTFAQDWLSLVLRNDFVRPWALAEWNTRLRAMRRNQVEFFRTPVTAAALATFSPVARAAAYMQTRIDLARLACVIELHRRTTGQLPLDLTSLAPQWIERIPRDAIGGGRYFYRSTENSTYVLYGRGWNARDDGGSSANANAILGPSTADDWVWEARPRWPQAAVR